LLLRKRFVNVHKSILKSRGDAIVQNVRLIALPCRISKGAFSDERVFEIDLPDAPEPYVGAASRQYCWDQEGRPLSKDDPEEGVAIHGKIAARLLGNRGEKALVSIPDGEVIVVNANQVIPRPPERVPNVPVKS
jgi:hypothetical protein